MSLLVAVKLLIVASIVLSVISLAMQARLQNVLYLFRNPGSGLRAFLSMYLIVPAVALGIVLAFELKPGVELALLVLSLSPVPPLLPKKQLKAGARGDYTTGLIVAAALVSLVAMPVGLHLFGTVFGRDVHVSTAVVAKTLAITIAIPMVLGFIAQKLLGARSERVAGVIGKIATLMLLVGAVAALVMLGSSLWALVGQGTLLALAGMIVAGLAAGYLLGGKSRSERAALSLASATRHPGVAMGVAAGAFPDIKQALAAILIFVLLNAVIGIPYLKILHHGDDDG